MQIEQDQEALYKALKVAYWQAQEEIRRIQAQIDRLQFLGTTEHHEAYLETVKAARAWLFAQMYRIKPEEAV
jgi:hypothetical protein